MPSSSRLIGVRAALDRFCIYLQGTSLTASLPSMAWPAKVTPESEADVSPQAIPVSVVLKWRTRSSRPSALASSMCADAWAIAVAFGPNLTVEGATVVASKVSEPRIATGMLPLLLGLMLLGSLPGLMSMPTIPPGLTAMLMGLAANGVVLSSVSTPVAESTAWTDTSFELTLAT